MISSSPITPPMEMIEEWYDRPPGTSAVQLAAKSAQWGADQELEACCEWTREYFGWNRSIQDADQLRSARRPKPPSLKEQALTALRDSPVDPVDEMLQLSADVELIIRRALEALDD